MFFRRTTDGVRTPVALEQQFAGPERTACWIVGGGPSLARLPLGEIEQTPAPRFAINLGGAGLLRPHFWTAYDPTARFHQSLYLDAGILKFVPAGRAMDLTPGGFCKVCECPNLVFFEKDPGRGFHQFPAAEEGVTDWQDSLILAIEIAYRLGFRDLYLAGCDMQVQPGAELRAAAETLGVVYSPGELLGEFCKRCRVAGVPDAALQSGVAAGQYHFDESKSLAAAVQSDFHYFRVAEYLRLSRRSLSLSGLRLHSVTPDSRLNRDLPYLDVAEARRRIVAAVGDPQAEMTRGKYTTSAPPRSAGPMRDFPPHFWKRPERGGKKKQAAAPRPADQAAQASQALTPSARERLRAALPSPDPVAIPLIDDTGG